MTDIPFNTSNAAIHDCLIIQGLEAPCCRVIRYRTSPLKRPRRANDTSFLDAASKTSPFFPRIISFPGADISREGQTSRRGTAKDVGRSYILFFLRCSQSCGTGTCVPGGHRMRDLRRPSKHHMYVIDFMKCGIILPSSWFTKVARLWASCRGRGTGGHSLDLFLIDDSVQVPGWTLTFGCHRWSLVQFVDFYLSNTITLSL